MNFLSLLHNERRMIMAKLILTEAAYNGIKGVKERELNHSEEYKKLVQEANQKIEEGRQRERKAWIDASKY